GCFRFGYPGHCPSGSGKDTGSAGEIWTKAGMIPSGSNDKLNCQLNFVENKKSIIPTIMKNSTFTIGIVGLGVMGRNFALNIADNGYSVIGLDNDEGKASTLEEEAGQKTVKGTTDANAFIAALKQPRAVMLLVPAGSAVDSVIEKLVPLLDEDDLIIDRGNPYFTDTNRHFHDLQDEGIHFLGIGVSGGAKGARLGPSMMPGGPQEAYERIKSIFEAAAAKVD